MRTVTAIIAFALLSATPALAHADEVHVHIGTLLDYVDISTYQQVCAKIARTPNTRVDQIANVNGTEIPFSFRWQCVGHQLFLNDGGEACMDADNPIRCLGEPAKTGWIRVTTQEPPAPRAPPAAAVPNPFSALSAAPPPRKHRPPLASHVKRSRPTARSPETRCRRSSATVEPVRLSYGGASRAGFIHAKPEPMGSRAQRDGTAGSTFLRWSMPAGTRSVCRSRTARSATFGAGSAGIGEPVIVGPQVTYDLGRRHDADEVRRSGLCGKRMEAAGLRLAEPRGALDRPSPGTALCRSRGRIS